MTQNPDNEYPKINFNLDAAQYVPKELLNYVKDVEDYEEEVLEQIDDMIGNELEKEVMNEFEKHRNIECDYESDDEDKWIPDYRNCACCHGYVYKCKGKTPPNQRENPKPPHSCSLTVVSYGFACTDI